jgi:hypothetical protein
MEDAPPPAPPRPVAGKYRVRLTVNGTEHTRDIVVQDIATRPE